MLHDRVEERADAGAVAGENHLVGAAVPDAERKLALDVVEHLFAMFFPQVGEEFGVGVGAEDVALAFEFGPLVGVVVKFAVEHGEDGAVFVRDTESLVSADSAAGNDGRVTVNVPDTDLNSGVAVPNVTVDSAPELRASACAPGPAELRSTFVQETRGSVYTPDGYLTVVSEPATAQTSHDIVPADGAVFAQLSGRCP